MSVRRKKDRIYVAVEGEGEQSFVRLLQAFVDQDNLNVHLDCRVLGGGGYETMLRQASQYRGRTDKQKTKAKSSILLVDSDRGDRNEDGWTLAQLNEKASKSDFHVCVQRPNQEGLLFRMLPGNEHKNPAPQNTRRLLTKQWPHYTKPVDFCRLSGKLTLEDLIRVARTDKSIHELLSIIGLNDTNT